MDNKNNRDFIGHHHVCQKQAPPPRKKADYGSSSLKAEVKAETHRQERRIRQQEGNFLSVWQPGIWQEEKSAALISQGNRCLVLVLIWLLIGYC